MRLAIKLVVLLVAVTATHFLLLPWASTRIQMERNDDEQTQIAIEKASIEQGRQTATTQKLEAMNARQRELVRQGDSLVGRAPASNAVR